MANGSTLITALRPARPGDLIEAGFFNKLIDAILELEQRVSILETEGRLVVPEEGGEPVRPIIITAAVARRTDTMLSFEVFGSGLEPDGLKTFSLNGQPFRPARLDGDDSQIRFLVEPRRIDLAGMVAGFSDSMMARESRESSGSGTSRFSTGVEGFASRSGGRAADVAGGIDEITDMAQPESTRLVLTIEAKSGARASRAVQLLR
jgi:hypothetical protein